jgi:hypothetical protein
MSTACATTSPSLARREATSRLLLAIVCFEASLAAALIVVSASAAFTGCFVVAPILFAGTGYGLTAP